MAVKSVPERPADQHETASRLRIVKCQNQARAQDRGQHRCDGERVAERDRNERQQHTRWLLPVQSERDREQPAHRRVEAVEEAEPGEGEPGQSSAEASLMVQVPSRAHLRESARLHRPADRHG